MVSVNVCSPPSVDGQCWAAYLTSKGLSFQVVWVRPRLTCDSLEGLGVVAIKGTWSTSFSNVEFKAVCIKDGFLKVFFIYENISKHMCIYSVRNNDKIIPLCAHYSA